ncbi:Heat shock protein DnaJ-like protein [Synechococcus sp. WH 8109]|uniref:DnaJ domain-containing protein n=1 Tax=Synechococcus sp. WH 8109 TaxID=166314 RepID=UPI0001B8D9C7|nr:DnaJ domain-containing protein [Synechococcus sp. WH 8109]AHF63636.1 Heat shock protein DnaJ-like protein [Synechococcus sp. WH 8109]
MTSTAEPDYWSLLGVDADCTDQQLKRAFRREARRWHPDLNSNDPFAEERFKLVNEAYAVLSDPRRREVWQRGAGFRADVADPFAKGFPDFEDYLDVIFGAGTGRSPAEVEDEPDSPVRGDDASRDSRAYETPVSAPPPPPPVRAVEDLESVVHLTPDQALQGSVVELTLDDGTVIELNTPPFAGDGWRLRLEGVAPGGRDHFLQLRVVTNDGLRIDGLRVLYKLMLFPPDAALGCAVDVPTLDGPVTLQVPPGSSSGRLLRLRGRGLQLDDERGDQLVEIVVVIPSDLGDAERALYRRLQELASESEQGG